MSGPLRVWRVRKQSAWLDARVSDCAGSSDVELQVFFDGTLLMARRWPSRQQAVDDAAGQLRDLQRAGWITHW